MKTYIIFLLLLVALFSCKRSTKHPQRAVNALMASAPPPPIQFGILVQPPDNVIMTNQQVLDFKIKVAKQVYVSCLRDGVNLDRPKLSNLLGEGYPVVMNINVTAPIIGNYAQFPHNLPDYQDSVIKIIDRDTAKPVVAVIENEWSNIGYYSDNAMNYVHELKSAIIVLHDRNILVADGGITMPPLQYLYAKWQGTDTTLKHREWGKDSMKLATDSMKHILARYHLGGDSLMKSAARADTVLKQIRWSKLDFCNFHWYYSPGDDLNDLRNCIDYLRMRTGKAAMSNEMGQFCKDPQVTRLLVQIAREKKLVYCLFYSAQNTQKSQPYHNGDASLTDNGNGLSQSLASASK